MKEPTWWSKLLRWIGIVLMALTAAFTLLSGAGTSCIALAAETYGEKWAPLVPYKWLYILFVVITLAIGVLGVRAVVLLVKGRPSAYRQTLLALILGVLVGAIHMAVSRNLRGGSSMPVDAVVYTTVLTLLVFLLFRLPPLWVRLGFDRDKSENTPAGGAAAIVVGVLTLTIHLWMGPTHTWGGVNYADVWHTALQALGWAFILLGISSAAYHYIPGIKRAESQTVSIAS